MPAHPAVDVAAAFERLTCLVHLQLASYRVAPWHAADVAVRKGIEETFDRLRAPLVDGRLSATAKEKRLAGKFIEMWTEVDRVDVSWRMESTALLSWALGLQDSLAPFDRQTTDLALLGAFVEPASVAAMRSRAAWRPLAELEALKAECDGWWERAHRARERYRALTVPTSTLSKKKQLALRAQLRDPASLFGKPYERLSWEEHSVAYSIAVERHTAITWLWSGTPWDELPVTARAKSSA
jgi:hypothetical protein